MELQIEDRLQEIYKNLTIEVSFKEFRRYEIEIMIEYRGIKYLTRIDYTYDANLTFDANINIIEHIIDTKVIISFFKEVNVNEYTN